MVADLTLPPVWTAALNAIGLPVLQIGLAWFFTRLPPRWFYGPAIPARKSGGAFWRWLRIKKWKHRLPDGAAWFAGGFPKGSLGHRDRGHLRLFLAETRRGEACHWTALALTPVFFLWNPGWADAVIAAYSLAANLPCILVQRYNRARLSRVLR